MQSAHAFLRGIIDYAGLFPPAGLDMDRAVAAYDSFLKGPDREFLGRFVLPVARLGEFKAAVRELDPSERWCLSVIAAGDADQVRDAAAAFNRQSANEFPAVIDTIEIAAGTVEEIAHVATLADEFNTFIEIPLSPDPEPLIAAIAKTRASAKMRTGGVVAHAFPRAEDVARFISLCHEAGVKFKATAGLHHLVKGEYPLTYETGAPRGAMFGYLNIFVAAAFAANRGQLREILDERDPSEFRFDSDGLKWRGHRVSQDELLNVRERVAVSFGSCSFDEPVYEAKTQGII